MNAQDTIIKKIRKLLTLAYGKGTTKSEAENAMAMAQRLMIKYNISMATVGETNESEFIHETFFKRRSQIGYADRYIVRLLEEFYKVRIIFNIQNAMHVLVIFGTPTDVEIAKYVHGYLRNVFFKSFMEYKNNAELWEVPNERAFYCGLYDAIRDRILKAEEEALQEESRSDLEQYAIVIRNRGNALRQYISGVFPKLNKIKERKINKLNSYEAGRIKGATVQINQAIKG